MKPDDRKTILLLLERTKEAGNASAYSSGGRGGGGLGSGLEDTDLDDKLR